MRAKTAGTNGAAVFQPTSKDRHCAVPAEAPCSGSGLPPSSSHGPQPAKIGQKNPFKLLNPDPAEMFPAAGRSESAARVAAKQEFRFPRHGVQIDSWLQMPADAVWLRQRNFTPPSSKMNDLDISPFRIQIFSNEPTMAKVGFIFAAKEAAAIKIRWAQLLNLTLRQ